MTDREALKGRYQDPARAARYLRRSPRRDRRELRLLERALRRLPSGLLLLDLAAGAGRAALLAGRRGHRVVAADASRAMLTAGAGAPSPVVADAFQLPFPDRTFDGVLCLRFLHHLTTPAARRPLFAEVARVARRFFLVSLRHPLALHALRRRRPGALSVRGLLRETAPFGFRLHRADPDLPLFREFWLVTLRR